MKTFKEITANKIVAKHCWDDAEDSMWEYMCYSLNLDKDSKWILSVSLRDMTARTAKEIKEEIKFSLANEGKTVLDEGTFDECLETLKKVGFKSWNELNLGGVRDLMVKDALDTYEMWENGKQGFEDEEED